MKKARQKQARRELTRCFFHKNHMLFIAALAVGIAINCSNLLFSYLIQRITDVAMGHDIAPLWRLLMITAVGIAAFFVLEWLWSVVKPRFVTRAVRQYKSHVFTRLMQKNIASFQREGSAEYISALTNDIAMIERDYLPQLTSIASLAAVFFGSLAMMLYYSPLLTVAGVALSLLPMAVSVVTGSRLAVREAQVSQRNAGFVGMVKDLLSGFSVLKSFRAEGEAQRLFNQENAALEESKRAWRDGAAHPYVGRGRKHPGADGRVHPGRVPGCHRAGRYPRRCNIVCAADELCPFAHDRAAAAAGQPQGGAGADGQAGR